MPSSKFDLLRRFLAGALSAVLITALSACSSGCPSSTSNAGILEPETSDASGAPFDGGMPEPPDSGVDSIDAGGTSDAGCASASDSGPLVFASATATENQVVAQSNLDGGTAPPTIGWQVPGTCDAIADARLSDHVSGVVSELSALSVGDEKFFVGTLVKRMPWTASFLANDLAAIVAISVETGQVAACVPLPEPPPQTGFRGTIQMVASEGNVFLAVAEGWAGSQGDEGVECPECERTIRRVLWRFDGAELVKLDQSNSDGSAGAILPIGGRRLLSVEDKRLSLLRFDGSALWRGQVDSDLLRTCFGRRQKIVSVAVGQAGSLLLTIRETWPNDELVEILPDGTTTVRSGVQEVAAPLGASGQNAIFDGTRWNSSVGNLDCAVVGQTFRDGVFCARLSFEQSPGSLVALSESGVSEVALIDRDASFFLAVSSGTHFLAVHSGEDLTQLSVSVATQQDGILGTLVLNAIGTDIPPFLLSGGAIVQTRSGLVRVSHPGLRLPDSDWPRGFQLGGNTNSGRVRTQQ